MRLKLYFTDFHEFYLIYVLICCLVLRIYHRAHEQVKHFSRLLFLTSLKLLALNWTRNEPWVVLKRYAACANVHYAT